jgi:mRNA-degrading endonuclease toxin of MazEF toxin-antitoxin module
MLRRGDIVELARPRIGFAREGSMRLGLVIQADPANEALETTVVVPLDHRFDPHEVYPFEVIIPAAEIGAAADHVAQVHLLERVFQRRIGDCRGSASAATMARVGAALALLLAMR